MHKVISCKNSFFHSNRSADSATSYKENIICFFKQGKLRSLAFQINHSLRWKRFLKDTIQRRSSTERNIPWA